MAGSEKSGYANSKAMILENGSIRSIGDIDTVSAEYEEMISGD